MKWPSLLACCAATFALPSACGASGGARESGDAGADVSSTDAAPDAVTDADDGYPDGSVPPSSATVDVLGYRVVAADSIDGSTIVLISDAPSNALHFYDVSTRVDRVVPLAAAPRALAIGRGGHMAIVGYDRYVAWVDLDAAALLPACDAQHEVLGLAMTPGGDAYVWTYPYDSRVLALQRSGCVVQEVLATFAWRVRARPGGADMLFLDDSWRFFRCPTDVASDGGSPPYCPPVGPTASAGSYCGDFWLSADGLHLYSQCGITLQLPRDLVSGEWSMEGSLAGLYAIHSLVDSPVARRLAILTATHDVSGNPTSPNPGSDGDTVVRVYDTASLAPLPPIRLPRVAAAVAHGLFVTATPSFDRIAVVAQANRGLVDDFAVVTIVP